VRHAADDDIDLADRLERITRNRDGKTRGRCLGGKGLGGGAAAAMGDDPLERNSARSAARLLRACVPQAMKATDREPGRAIARAASALRAPVRCAEMTTPSITATGIPVFASLRTMSGRKSGSPARSLPGK
jgi:hypothetical protein